MRVEIDLFSDFICPWSYIGKRQLDNALRRFAAERPDVDVRIRWTPYLLDPDTPAEGLPFRASLDARYESAADAEATMAEVTEAGKKAGIDFKLDRIAVLPNTQRAHRLIYKAQTDGLSHTTINGLAEGIFSAYFIHGENIGDPAVLGRIARTRGQDEVAVIAYLGGDEDAAAVDALARLGGAMGIGGVPCFVFNRNIVLQGARSSAALGETLQHCVESMQTDTGQ